MWSSASLILRIPCIYSLEAPIGLENYILTVESVLPFGDSVHGFSDCSFCWWCCCHPYCCLYSRCCHPYCCLYSRCCHWLDIVSFSQHLKTSPSRLMLVQIWIVWVLVSVAKKKNLALYMQNIKDEKYLGRGRHVKIVWSHLVMMIYNDEKSVMI